MQPRSIPWFWIAIGALLLLGPATAGRLLIDVLGGLTLMLLLLPVVLGAAGWIGWKVLQSRLRNCAACGFNSMGGGELCPACGTAYGAEVSGNRAAGVGMPGFGGIPGGIEIDASEVIIDVQATDVSKGSKSGD